MTEKRPVFVYSYRGYTITSINGKFWITYPNEEFASVYTLSLTKAYLFVDEMIQG